MSENQEDTFVSMGGLMFEGQRTTLRHGDRIIFHSSGCNVETRDGNFDMGFLEVNRNGVLLERQEGDTKFPFDNRFHGGCPGKEPVNLLALVLTALANMANLDADLCRSDYDEGRLKEEEYQLVEPGCRIAKSGKVTRP